MKKVIKRKVKIFLKVLKVLLCIIYFTITESFIVYVFVKTCKEVGNFWHAFAIANIAFVVMDIICSMIEDYAKSVYCFAKKRKQKKEADRKAKLEQEKKKAKELEEALLYQKKNYQEDVKDAILFSSKFIDTVKKEKENIPTKVFSKLREICKLLNEILEMLHRDPDEYYNVRHVFSVYFPKFEEITNKYIDILKANTLDQKNTDEFLRLIEEFKKYLEFIKENIDYSDKLDLNVGIIALTRALEKERKKGDKDAEV